MMEFIAQYVLYGIACVLVVLGLVLAQMGIAEYILTFVASAALLVVVASGQKFGLDKIFLHEKIAVGAASGTMGLWFLGRDSSVSIWSLLLKLDLMLAIGFLWFLLVGSFGVWYLIHERFRRNGYLIPPVTVSKSAVKKGPDKAHVWTCSMLSMMAAFGLFDAIYLGHRLSVRREAIPAALLTIVMTITVGIVVGVATYTILRRYRAS